MSALAMLRRSDKHYLGAGDGTLFAPPHPLWLDRPGYWDGGHIFLYGLAPLFTATLVLEDGAERRLSLERREWTPAGLAATYRAGALEVEERRSVLAGGRFVTELRVTNEGAAVERCHLVAWTAQEGTALEAREQVTGGREGIAFRAMVNDAQLRTGHVPLSCALALDGPADGWGVHESQHPGAHANAPLWDTTPFRDRWAGRGLTGARELAPRPPERGRTLVFMGLARELALNPGASAWTRVTFHAVPADPALRWRSPVREAEPLPGGSAKGPPAAFAATESARAAWDAYFQEAPGVASSDPRVERYFAYRWYGLRLNFLEPAGNYAHPTCTEGIEFFHCPISYSAWTHMRELRWLPDPARARGALLTFLDHQKDDGALPGRVYLDHMRRTDFYLADWGGSLLALDAVHPDDAFLASVYEPLVRYADWLDRDRDTDRSGLYDVRDPYETGQENMSRYTAVDPAADQQHFEFALRLKGVDATIYTYRLRRALARVAARVGRGGEVAVHDAVADRIAEAVRRHMWSAADGMFSDVDPATMRRTGVRAAVCFYPYMTDIAGPEHLDGLERNLLDPKRFWLPYPVPSTAADDPTFDADARWKGVRHSCTWNGRVWPMTNAHLVDALGRAASLDPRFRQPAAELLERTLRMLFFDGEADRPNAFEHYSPLTGWPSVYRGIDDYQHSWINDLLIRWAVGFRPLDDDGRPGFTVDPLPLRIQRLRLERLPFRGTRVAVEHDEDGARVEVDGHMRVSAPPGEPLEVRL